MIKPALLIGTGFHYYVSGNVESYEKLAPLVSWNSLINAVGRKAGLALPSYHLPPVYRWEGVVHQAGTEGFNGINDEFYATGTIGSDEVQLHLKQLAADVIKKAGSYSPTKRAMFPNDELWGSVISLNYDQAWINSPLAQLQGAVPDLYELPDEEKQRLTAFVLYNGKRIWFPNGTISDPASIRIGLSDYGTKAYGIARMLNIISDFESKHLPAPENEPRTHVRNSVLVNALDNFEQNSLIQFTDVELSKEFPVSWVAEALYRPLAIVGCGLSDSETGLWHLLRERQRYQAKLPLSQQKPVRILLSQADSRSDFWQARPFGIEPVFCSDWDEGWDRLRVSFDESRV